MLNGERLSALAPGCALAGAATILEETGSTMDAAREALGAREPPFVVCADRQSAGRGRGGRTWIAQPGLDLAFTAVIGMPCPTESLPALTLALGVGLHEAVALALSAAGMERGRALAGLTLKWPNDLLWSGRKIAGVLCESVQRPGRDAAVLAGVGLDVNSTAFPPEIEGIAFSLRLIAGREIDREQALACALSGIEGAASLYASEGLDPFREEWIGRCSLWGMQCTAGAVSGTMETLDEAGGLVLGLPSGGRATVTSGPVEMAAIRE